MSGARSARGLITSRLAVALLCLTGCAARPALIRKPFLPPVVVAVLPFANDTNNLDAPEMMRKLSWLGLSRGGYRMVPLEETEEKLRKAGITDGGQLGSKTAPELAALLGADAVLYGTVNKFSYITLGVYLQRKVAVTAELVGADGTPLWRHSASATRVAVELDRRKAAEAFAVQLAVKWIEKIINHPLYPEMQRSLYELYLTLPAAQGGKSVGRHMDRGYDQWDDGLIPLIINLLTWDRKFH